MKLAERILERHQELNQRHCAGGQLSLTDVPPGNVNVMLRAAHKDREDLLDLLTWRPLPTAPRDGTFVELRGDSGMRGHPYRVMLARYEASREDAGCISRGLATKDEHCWRNILGDCCTDDGPMPTHWRPAS